MSVCSSVLIRMGYRVAVWGSALLCVGCAYGVDLPSEGTSGVGGYPGEEGQTGGAAGGNVAVSDAEGVDADSDAGSPGVATDADAGPLDAGPMDAGPLDAGPLDAGALSCHPVINEVLTALSSAASHEWVEVFNPCGTPFSMMGWKLVYRSASGSSDVTLFTWGQESLAAGEYRLIVGSALASTAGEDGVFKSGGLAAAGGGLELRDAAGARVDSMGYGTATNGFVEGQPCGAPAATPSPGHSVARIPNGADTDNNAADFTVVSSPTRRGHNL